MFKNHIRQPNKYLTRKMWTNEICTFSTYQALGLPFLLQLILSRYVYENRQQMICNLHIFHIHFTIFAISNIFNYIFEDDYEQSFAKHIEWIQTISFKKMNILITDFAKLWNFWKFSFCIRMFDFLRELKTQGNIGNMSKIWKCAGHFLIKSEHSKKC